MSVTGARPVVVGDVATGVLAGVGSAGVVSAGVLVTGIDDAEGGAGVGAGEVAVVASSAMALAMPIDATRPSMVETPRPAAAIRAPLAGWRRR